MSIILSSPYKYPSSRFPSCHSDLWSNFIFSGSCFVLPKSINQTPALPLESWTNSKELPITCKKKDCKTRLTDDEKFISLTWVYLNNPQLYPLSLIPICNHFSLNNYPPYYLSLLKLFLYQKFEYNPSRVSLSNISEWGQEKWYILSHSGLYDLIDIKDHRSMGKLFTTTRIIANKQKENSKIKNLVWCKKWWRFQSCAYCF